MHLDHTELHEWLVVLTCVRAIFLQAWCISLQNYVTSYSTLSFKTTWFYDLQKLEHAPASYCQDSNVVTERWLQKQPLCSNHTILASYTDGGSICVTHMLSSRACTACTQMASSIVNPISWFQKCSELEGLNQCKSHTVCIQKALCQAIKLLKKLRDYN